jgi:hypothetical protein
MYAYLRGDVERVAEGRVRFLLIVGFHTVRAALANPAAALRYE